MVLPVTLNFAAIIVAAIVSYVVIGMLWYSPALFGKTWMKLMGFDKKTMQGKKKGMGGKMVAGFIATLIMSFVLAHVIDYAQAVTFVEGLMVGFWIWLGFIATVLLSSVLWEGRPVKLYGINVLYYLVSLLVMSTILTMWI